ncbi:CAP domain-containing protein [Sphingomonas sp. PR090111-T3T-6A]|uniref:CAP domain-containing protein n=1 Tax=Sphingomonas sp. PR090111-T3T-6A TaxID=685778 RepID=UPI000363FF97|nr:CAP domain-containing protein [Sphingomonas sp. PR090111-T3T-6A]
MRSGFVLAVLAAVLPSAPAFSMGMTLGERATVLAAHNSERAAVGVGPILWSPKLAADAERWAVHLARINTMIHYGSMGEPDNGEGENLFMGTARAYRVDQMIGYWSDEKRVFRRVRRWDQNGRTFEAVGHYTQMVWRDTREVGCAIASNSQYDFLVCRYARPGNVLGSRPF